MGDKPWAGAGEGEAAGEGGAPRVWGGALYAASGYMAERVARIGVRALPEPADGQLSPGDRRARAGGAEAPAGMGPRPGAGTGRAGDVGAWRGRGSLWAADAGRASFLTTEDVGLVASPWQGVSDWVPDAVGRLVARLVGVGVASASSADAARRRAEEMAARRPSGDGVMSPVGGEAGGAPAAWLLDAAGGLAARLAGVGVASASSVARAQRLAWERAGRRGTALEAPRPGVDDDLALAPSLAVQAAGSLADAAGWLALALTSVGVSRVAGDQATRPPLAAHRWG